MLDQNVSVKKLIEVLERVQGQCIEHITVFELLHILPQLEAAQKGVQRTAIYCSECGGLGNVHTVMCSQFAQLRRR